MKRRDLFAATAALLLAGVLPSAAQDADAAARAVLKAATVGFIQPGYERFHQEAQLMRAAADALCEAPDAARLDEARTAFGTLVEAWSRIEIVRFGPVISDNRMERIFFFPDRRSIGLKQIQALLVEKDPSALDSDTLADKSVALQGLGALEYVLFGSGSDALAGGDSYRCGVARAVAARIEATAGELVSAWTAPDGIAARFSDPQPDYADFRTVEEGLRALLGVFINSTEFVADIRIAPFVGDNAESAKPKRAAFWRAGLTARSLKANFDGLEHLFDVSAMDELLPPDIRLEARSVTFEFANAHRALATPQLPLPQAAADPVQRGALQYLLIVTRSIRRLFTERMAVGLGLSAGFSSLDGD